MAQKRSTDSSNTNSLSQYTHLQETISACSRVLCSAEKSRLPDAIYKVLELTGTALCADRAYLYEISSDHITDTFEWCAEGVSSIGGSHRRLLITDVRNCLDWISEHKPLIAEDLRTIPPECGVSSSFLSSAGIHSIALLPILIENVLSGFVGIDNYNCPGLQNEQDFLNSISYFLSFSLRLHNTITRLTLMNHYDALTGLRNRNSFISDSERGYLFPLGVIYVDLNGLKNINDRFGHRKGDQILSQIAQVILEYFPQDFCYRMGGDEYVIICQGISRKDFDERANDLKNTFSANPEYSVSIGFSWGYEDQPLDELLSMADHRMYLDKKNFYRGKPASDRYRFITDDLLDLKKPGKLAELIEDECFKVFYQPKFAANTRLLVGAEALVRFHKDHHTWEPPSQFVPFLESSDLISALDYYVFEIVCCHLSQWLHDGLHVVPVSINFSRATIRKFDFVERITAIIDKYKIPKDYIELEITESLADCCDEEFFVTLNNLKDVGIKIAIDDFGVRYANLSLLIDVEFNTLKIDKDITDSLYFSEKARRFLSSITKICREMGISITVEGVETEEQMAVIQELNCDDVQGFLLCKPIPAENFLQDYLEDSAN